LGEWSIHGGKLAAARRAYPDAPGPWLDLSTGINPHPWPIERAAPIDWARLPDDDALADLEAAAAGAFGVSPDRVCSTPGSEIALRLLGLLDLPRPYRHVAPGYRTHGESLPGSTSIPPEEIGMARNGTLLFARPANPQGQLWASASSDVRLIIDEAFADAMPGAASPPGPNAIRLRSFGKFYGLPGIRLGFVIAPPDDIAAFRRHLGSWPVSTAAIAIGAAAYRDAEWQKAMRERLAGECDALDAMLQGHGLRPEGACPLFRLIRSPDAAALFDRLARCGILTRPFDHSPDWLRIGLPGSPDALDRLDRALAGG
jgi:cobalamin biosynthetic protein CobC